MARGTPARLAEEECHLRLQAVHAGALQRLAAALAAAVEEEARGQRRCILKHLHQQPACAVARAALDPGAPLARGGRAGRAATGARTQRVWPLAQVEEDVLPVEVALGQVGQRVRVGPAGQVRVPPGALEHLRGAARRGAPAQLARSSGWSVRFQRLPPKRASMSRRRSLPVAKFFGRLRTPTASPQKRVIAAAFHCVHLASLCSVQAWRPVYATCLVRRLWNGTL
jgi:hypothetical protein